MRKSLAVTSALVLTLLATAGSPVFSGPHSSLHGKARSVSPAFAPGIPAFAAGAPAHASGAPAFAAGAPAFAAGEIVVKLKNRAEAIPDARLRVEEVDRSAAALSSRVGA